VISASWELCERLSYVACPRTHVCRVCQIFSCEMYIDLNRRCTLGYEWSLVSLRHIVGIVKGCERLSYVACPRTHVCRVCQIFSCEMYIDLNRRCTLGYEWSLVSLRHIVGIEVTS
jgi:hypothetical protein